jgi:hypothetical protein
MILSDKWRRDPASAPRGGTGCRINRLSLEALNDYS